MKQEEINNIGTIAQLEYSIDLYFDKNVQRIVDSEYKTLKRNQQKEYLDLLDKRPVAPGQSGMMNASMAAQEVGHVGKWNKKDTDYVVNVVENKVMGSKAINEDFSAIMSAWKDAVIDRIGKTAYDKLSKKCVTKDFAQDYFMHRFNDKIMNRLARLGAPKSSLEYIITRGAEGSFIGSHAGSKESSEKDKELRTRIDAMFSDSTRLGGKVASFVADLPLTGKNPFWLTIDGYSTFDEYIEDKKKISDLKSFDNGVSYVLFGDKNVLAKLRNPSYSGANKDAPVVKAVNGCVNRKMFAVKCDNAAINKLRDVCLENFDGDCSSVPENIAADCNKLGIKVRTGGNAPAWMLTKQEEELHRNMFFYFAVAKEMKEKGVEYKKIGNKMMSLQDVCQQSYDYSVASRTLQKQREENERQAIEYQQAQERQAAQIVNQQTGNGATTDMMKSAVDGWSPLMKTLGLDGVGDVGKNLGFALATLPDMLIGMFTGKSKSLKLENNILPVLSIMAGFFVKNPILKLMFIGLGGMNLMNKGTHEQMDKQLEKEGRQPAGIKRYDDEELNRRVSNVAVNGNSIALMIDGEVFNAVLDDNTMSAYEMGYIPLNTLANAVLNKYDEQRKAMEQQYDLGVADNIEMDRNVAIR